MKYVKLGVYSIRRIRTYVILLYALLQIMLCYFKFLEAWSRRDKFKVCTITGLVWSCTIMDDTYVQYHRD